MLVIQRQKFKNLLKFELQVMMKLKELMILNAIAYAIIGIPLLLAPAKIMAMFGLHLNSDGMIMAQLFGGALLGNCLVVWFSRKDTGSISLHATILYLIVYNGINFLVIFWATAKGIMEFTGYSAAIGFLLFALSYGYLLVAKLKVI